MHEYQCMSDKDTHKEEEDLKDGELDVDALRWCF
jgi:hypothetical protein